MLADRLPVTVAVLADRARALGLWALALAAICGMYIGLYPSFPQDELEGLVESLPEGVVSAFGYDQIGTAAGYVDSTVYGLLGPILLAVFAIGVAARTLAGKEEDGTLELEVASPLTRRRVYLERLLALVVQVVVLVVVLGVTTAALTVGLDLDLGLGRVAEVSVGLALFALLAGALALAAGAATGRRAVALGVGAGVIVAGFVLDAIGPMLEAGWMTAVSPWSWFVGSEVALLHGADWGRYALMAAVAIVVLVGGALRFERRDLMV